jgi:hypothetical protein
MEALLSLSNVAEASSSSPPELLHAASAALSEDSEALATAAEKLAILNEETTNKINPYTIFLADWHPTLKDVSASHLGLMYRLADYLMLPAWFNRALEQTAAQRQAKNNGAVCDTLPPQYQEAVELFLSRLPAVVDYHMAKGMRPPERWQEVREAVTWGQLDAIKACTWQRTPDAVTIWCEEAAKAGHLAILEHLFQPATYLTAWQEREIVVAAAQSGQLDIVMVCGPDGVR